MFEKEAENLYLCRFNDSFILNDFMYSDSVVRYGFANVFNWEDDTLFQNGSALADLLDSVCITHGQMSVSYGYISPEISQKTVRWQNPNNPSYHRWDKGAAADILVHDYFEYVDEQKGNLFVGNPKRSPIALACEIAEHEPFSRMITYSESAHICVAASYNETISKKYRRAFYENRYMGQRGAKPKFYTHSKPPEMYTWLPDLEKHSWVGAGYPTYHLKKRPQAQHHKLGRYLTLLDCLRCPERVTEGIANRPPIKSQKKQNFIRVARAMSYFMERALDYTSTGGMSIVSGHNALYRDPLLKDFTKGLEHISSDWGTGEGMMCFSVSKDFAKEFRKSMAGKHQTRKNWYELDDYLFQLRPVVGPWGDSTLLHVTWRK